MVSISATPTLMRRLPEAKLIVVGQGSVGKTSLVKALTSGGPFDRAEEKTDGIEITTLLLQSNENDENIRLNVWNFGGQEIMHATHQFFLTKRSLYLLVLDSRLTQEENRTEYWLTLIEAFSESAPVFIIGNKIDQHPLDINRAGLREKFPNIVAIFETSALSGEGIDELRKTIFSQASQMEFVTNLYPTAWITVKEEIQSLQSSSKFITLESYIEICKTNGIANEKEQISLLSFLNDLGVIIYFSDNPRLESLGVLNPEWITKGVYKILNSRTLFQNKGKLTLSILDEILNTPEYPRGQHLFIIDVMKKFELCFDIEVDKEFLVPDLLPKDTPHIGGWVSELEFQYFYDVLPSSIITRFIVRMHKFILSNTVWRTGVLLDFDSSQAIVKSDTEASAILISVIGGDSKDALAIIRGQFESIHSSISKLRVTSRIPLVDHPDAGVIDLDLLLALEKNGIETYRLVASGKIITLDVKLLLDKILTNHEREKIKLSEGDSEDGLLNTKAFIETSKRIKVITDQPTGADKLKFSLYSDAFADLIANPEMNTPITIGIYGRWGSGKSFLMGKIRDAIKKPRAKWRWYDARGILQQFGAKKTEINIQVVEFNAWVYSGSEHLWASLVTHLYRDIEKSFGLRAHIMRLGKAIKKSFPSAIGIFSFYAVLGFLLSLVLNFNNTTTSAEALRLAINTVAGSIIGGSALASLPVLWKALREFSDNLLLSRAHKLQSLAARPDFSSQIGIMADIKDEIKFIRELLNKGKDGKPTRLVLFIDDLDRCEHRKAIEVLQAIMLLLADEDGSPFVIVLGLDARVIVRAIEEHYGKVLVKAGINGYEYLDKIIQLPFVIPASRQSEIENYVDSLLWSSEQEKTTVTERFSPALPEKQEQKVEENTEKVPESQFDLPQLPTDVLVQEAAKQQAELRQPEKKLEEISVTFRKDEREALKACTADLTENPRKIKRIINIYRLVRTMLPEDLRIKAIRWILLTEQWPYHTAWMIEYIENDFRTNGSYKDKQLLDVFQVAKKNIHKQSLYTLLEIDADPYQFENFIKKEPAFTVQEIQALLPYTFNLNPAIRSEVNKFAVKMESY